MANEYEHTTNLGVRSSNLFGRASDLRDLGWKDRWLASQKLILGSKSGPTIDRSGAEDSSSPVAAFVAAVSSRRRVPQTHIWLFCYGCSA